MNKKKIEQFDFIDFTDEKGRDNTAISDLLGVIWRNRFWFVLSIIIALSIAVIHVRSTPKTFSRTATILIKDDKKGGGGISEAAAFKDMFSLGSNSVYNEIGVLKSRHLMTQVVEQLKLETNYQIKDGLRLKDLYTSSPIEVECLDDVSLQGTFSITITPLENKKAKLTYVEIKEDSDGKVTETTIVDDISLDSVFEFRYGKVKVKSTLFMNRGYIDKDIIITKNNIKNIAKSYIQKLNIECNDKQSTIVLLSIIDTNPQRAEDIINTLVSVYENSAIDNKNKVLSKTVDFITDKTTVLENDLKLIDSDIEKYKKEKQLTDIPSVSSMYLNTSSRINAEALELENQLSLAYYMKEYLQNNSNQSELIPVNLGINSGGIESQIAKYNETMTLRNKLLANSTSNNPIINDLQISLVSMRSSILSSVDNLVASLKIQLKKYHSEEQKSSSKIADVSSQYKFMVNIERQLKIKEELYLYLLKKQEESEIQLTTTESNCTVVDVADGSNSPVAPNKMQIILIALVLGFVVPAIWLYIRSLLNTSVYTQKDIKNSIDIPFVGELPLEKRKENDNSLVVEDCNRNVINETFRLLRDNIEMMNAKEATEGTVVLFTSFNAGAGKTFATSNLALTISLSNKKVILLDIDLRKGSLGKRFGFDRKTSGVTTYLSGKVNNIDDIINGYGNSSLDIISSGALPPNPAELLKTEKLGILITELKKRYDYIIVDSAPYGLVTDTGIIAKYADLSIIVVRSGRFDKRQLPALAELYKSETLNNLSVLLNAVNINKIGYGYGYGYSYGYGYGYGYGNKVTKNLRHYIRLILGI
ncbi:polysaccharide biosynthesis tyrosine autokinase [Bacteroides sp.]|uniref:GumC family protein n=1 Tax=Bacteroides sp. TaxID=29523 RepID=UPI002627ABE9|nr:polysaccharide biosynthesis tyrosine autokinase [Bacteroides sp.]MDD3038747.1 polysaccharide biosynthesis tyrosine autokinase [Bacteroides sp.]